MVPQSQNIPAIRNGVRYCPWPNRYVFSCPLNALRDKLSHSWWQNVPNWRPIEHKTLKSRWRPGARFTKNLTPDLWQRSTYAGLTPSLLICERLTKNHKLNLRKIYAKLTQNLWKTYEMHKILCKSGPRAVWRSQIGSNESWNLSLQ